MLLGNNGIIRYKWNWSHTKHVSSKDYAGFWNRTAVIAAVIRMRRPIVPSKRERSPNGDAGFFGKKKKTNVQSGRLFFVELIYFAN